MVRRIAEFRAGTEAGRPVVVGGVRDMTPDEAREQQDFEDAERPHQDARREAREDHEHLQRRLDHLARELGNGSPELGLLAALDELYQVMASVLVELEGAGSTIDRADFDRVDQVLARGRLDNPKPTRPGRGGRRS